MGSIAFKGCRCAGSACSRYRATKKGDRLASPARPFECRSAGGPVDVAPQKGDWAVPPYLHGGPILVEGREQCEFACTRDTRCKVGHFGGSGKCWLSAHLASAGRVECKLLEGSCASFVKMVPMVQSSNLR